MSFEFRPIGTIFSPYMSLNAPHQPIIDAPGEFWISINPEYRAGLVQLEKYRYIYVLYYFDQINTPVNMNVKPDWALGKEVGVFASRTPNRPNPIGLSIVQIKEIDGNDIIISGIDVYNGTPLLDIKPYIECIDIKNDANNGWFDDLPDHDHLVAHMLGLPHDHHDGEHQHTTTSQEQRDSHGHKHGHKYKYERGHGHKHEHGHQHQHEHEHDD